MTSNVLKIVLAVGAIAVIALLWSSKDEIMFQFQKVPGVSSLVTPTVDGQIAKYGDAARERLKPLFQSQGLQYPPAKVAFILIKASKELMVYTAAADGPYQYVSTYKIVQCNVKSGPKLTAGDNQVPEGLYTIALEPNTPYHLALKLSYPNDSDKSRAEADERKDIAGDIFIQGSNSSGGCIAVGDQASEDLFVLVNDVSDKVVPIVIAPVDFRSQAWPQGNVGDPAWLPVLYGDITKELFNYPNPGVW
jgi:hypothetical protein